MIVPSTSDPIDFRISDLLARHLAGLTNPEEEKALQKWLSDPENRAFFERIQSDEVIAAKIDRYVAEDVDQAFEHFKRRRKQHSRQVRIRRWWVAAAVGIPVALAASLFLPFGPKTSAPDRAISAASTDGLDQPRLTLSGNRQVILTDTNLRIFEENGTIALRDGLVDYSALNEEVMSQDAYNLLEVPASFTYHLILSDGTKVWMNAQSSLRFPVTFGRDERVVEASGEVYFEVQPDADRPFFVQTNGLKVAVTGTSFNVHHYPNEAFAQITLTEGQVQVHVAEKIYALTPGKQLHWDHQRNTLTTRTVNVDEFTSWREGTYIFKSRQLDEVLRVAERWFDVQFVVADESVTSSIYTGILIKDEQLEQFLARLENTSDYTFKREGRLVSVQERRNH